MKNFVLVANRDYTPKDIDNIEEYLKSNDYRYESYPLKNQGWEIRFKGEYIGKWKGFEYVKQYD